MLGSTQDSTGEEVKLAPLEAPEDANKLLRLWKRVEPYKEILSAAFAVIAVLSSGTAYVAARAVSYFAARSDVVFLQCRFEADVALKAQFDLNSIIQQIEWREAELTQLAQQIDGSNNTKTATIMTQLSTEIRDRQEKLTKMQEGLRHEEEQKLFFCFKLKENPLVNTRAAEQK